MEKRICTGLILVSLSILLSGIAFAQVPRVNTMPDGIRNLVAGIDNAYAWPDTPLVVWGNVVGGTAPYTYSWDFGDGSPAVNGSVANPRDIAVSHAYTSMGPKYAALIVTDSHGLSDTDQVRIDVVSSDSSALVNRAIEKGLKYLYLHNYGSIGWQGWGAEGQYRPGAFGMEVLAFLNRGHLATNDPDEDIYAEHVQRGFDIMFSLAYSQSIGVQTHGNPDTDGDGLGIYFSDGTRPLYETGIALMAIVASGTPDRVISSGSASVLGRTYIDVAGDVADYLGWAQNDAGAGRGGWRYTPNRSDADNSVTQWPAIGLEAAESVWGVTIPSFVKLELLVWATYSQNANGGFGYDWNGYPNDGRTGAGLCILSFCDVSYTNLRIQKTLTYLNNSWVQGCNVTDGNLGNYYAMYGIAKGCRIAVDSLGNPSEIAVIGSHYWQQEYNSYLITHQAADGHWDGCNYGSNLLDTDFGILILLHGITRWPVAVIKAPASIPASTSFEVDGSHSYHMDTSKAIVEWLWDFDEANGIDWSQADASGKTVTDPGYPLLQGTLADTFMITLRVKDNSIPPMYSTAKHRIIVDTLNHPPVADVGGPYAARVGDTIKFDGTNSFDPDPGDHIASYCWDLDGDNVFCDCTDSICFKSWSTVHSGYVGLIVTDTYGAMSRDTSWVTVWTSNMDVGVDSAALFFSQPHPGSGDTVFVRAAIYCDSLSDPVSDIAVRFFDGDPENPLNKIGDDQSIASMSARQVDTVEVKWVVPEGLPRMVYVVVDPDGKIEEYNELNNFDSISVGLGNCKADITPQPIYAYYENSVEPMAATIYLEDPEANYTVDDIDPASIKVNTSIIPISTEILDSCPGYSGKVMKIVISMADFIVSFPIFWDTTYYQYTLQGKYKDGSTFQQGCEVMMIGHRSGDVNGDGNVTILDIAYLVKYLYLNGPAPVPVVQSGDVNSSGNVNIADISYLVKYLFKNGPEPVCPPVKR
ncbi:MAG: PKD domain-containing protein [candidate division Zixibacteria bacterium]|nr:PKD domain-containing protein [candidate division Zixibacteria bacterium]